MRKAKPRVTDVYLSLEHGGRAALTGFRWPLPEAAEPGRWVTAHEAGGSVRGVPAEHLPWSLDETLWRMELAGNVRIAERAIVADRGRILSCIERWDAETAQELVDACTRRIAAQLSAALTRACRPRDATRVTDASSPELEHIGFELVGRDEVGLLAGFLSDVFVYARDAGSAAEAAGVSAYIAAHAAAGGDKMAPGYDERFEAERRWQVEWLEERLTL